MQFSSSDLVGLGAYDFSHSEEKMNDESLRIETGLSCPQTPSAQPRLSGITKKIYNYVSGNGQSPGMLEAETAPAQTSLVDAATAVLSPRISSMASNIASSLFKGKKSMDLEGQVLHLL